MPAEPAAAPDASGAESITDPTQDPAVATATPSDGGQETPTPVGGRAQQILTELGISDEVQGIIKAGNRQSETGEKATDEKDQKDKANDAGSAESPERADAGRPPAGEADKGQKAKAKDHGQTEDEEEPLTEQEKTAWPKEALARIHKTTAQKNALKTEREEAQRIATQKTEEARQLQEQLQNVSRARPVPTPYDPLADVMSVRDLHGATQQYEELLAFAEMNPDGLTDVLVGKDAAGKEIKRDFSAQEMAEIRATTGRILRQAVPARAVYLREQQTHEQYAKATLPEMFDPKTEEYKAAQQVVRTVPELTRLPGYQQWIAWAFIGRAKVLSELAAEENKTNGTNGKAATVDPKVAPFLMKHPPVAPSVPSTRGASTTVKPSKDSESKAALDQFFEEGGGDDALERLVARKRSLQAAPNKDAVLV